MTAATLAPKAPDGPAAPARTGGRATGCAPCAETGSHWPAASSPPSSC